MGELGLVLVVAWLLLVGGVRTAVHIHRTGQIPLRADDPAGTPQWWSRRIGVLAIILAFGACLAELAGFPSWGPLDTEAVRALGVGLAGLGVVLTIGAQLWMGASWRGDVDPDARTPLVTDGPFRLIRNPILTSNAVAALGIALVVPNLLAALMLVAIVAASEIQVRLVEEPYLLAVHGEAYRRYASRTGRFVPGIGRLPEAPPDAGG